MHYRTFGRTGLRVSTVSLGCNRLGDPGVDPVLWPPIVERALEAGVSLLDTSISYNQGRSEAIISQVTSHLSAPCYISSKVGFSIDFDLGGSYAQRDYSATAILRGIDVQLARLRRPCLDVCLLHSPSVRELESTDWARAIDTLRQQGKVRWFGISTSDHASGLWAIQHGADVLQIEFDLLNPSAADELLPAAVAHNVGIMVRTPLARGLLTGKFPVGQPIPSAQQWRRPKGEQLQLRLARVEQLRFLERPGQTLGQAAMRWVLSQPGVHCVVPGARTLEQLEENLAAADGELKPDELERVRALHAAWRPEGRW
jgi:aryl-alcohol dehydrogenase-like predicted oxidoreductase